MLWETSLFAQGSGGHYGCPFIGRDADLPLHVSRVIIFAPAFDLSIGRDFEHGVEACSYLFVVVEQSHVFGAFGKDMGVAGGIAGQLDGKGAGSGKGGQVLVDSGGRCYITKKINK